MVLLKKHDSSKQYTAACIKKMQEQYAEADKKEKKMIQESQQFIKDGLKTVNDRRLNSYGESYMANFAAEVKKSLLCECLYRLFNNCLDNNMKKNISETQARGIVSNFVVEQGPLKLLSSFKTKSNLLSEYASIINDHYKMIMEKCDKDNPDSFFINPSDIELFFDDIDAVNSKEEAIIIRNRVLDAEEEFLTQNAEEQHDMAEILRSTKEKIDNAKTDKIKESFNRQGKYMLNMRANMRKKNAYEKITEAYTYGIVNNKELLEKYSEDGHLKMGEINNNIEIMYTFLEMVNSLNIIRVDESYVNKIVNDLKNGN